MCIAFALIGASAFFIAPALAAPPVTQPAAKPVARPAKPAAAKRGTPASLVAAMKALATEYEVAMRQNTDLPRTASDYFKGQPPDDATADDVFAAVTRQMSGSPAEAAYVKWQLLSAVPGVADGPTVQKIQVAYVNAPKPQLVFSSDVSTRAMLDRALIGRSAAQEADLIAGFEKLAAPIARANGAILSYRHELLGRFPTSTGAILAQADDLSVRVTAGVVESGDYSAFESAVQGWAATGADANSVSLVQEAVRGMRNLRGPSAYRGSIDEDSNGTNLTWKRLPTSIDDTWVNDLAKLLSNVQSSPGGSGDGLKFKY